MTPSPAHQPGTTTGATVDERPRFEEVLAEHIAWGGEDEFDHCQCGWTDPESVEPFADHRAHLAAALKAEVDRWLADEGTRKRVAEAFAHAGTTRPLGTTDREWRTELATAALAALTTTTREDHR